MIKSNIEYHAKMNLLATIFGSAIFFPEYDSGKNDWLFCQRV